MLSIIPCHPTELLIRKFYSCCGCNSGEGSVVDGWTWNASGCCPWNHQPGWPESRSVRASWRRSCHWPWRRIWGGTWWRRAVGAYQWGELVCTTQWLCSRGPGGWRLGWASRTSPCRASSRRCVTAQWRTRWRWSCTKGSPQRKSYHSSQHTPSPAQ